MKFCLIILLAFLLAGSVALAQFDTGQISGFAKDESDAVLVGATVTVVNEGTRDQWMWQLPMDDEQVGSQEKRSPNCKTSEPELGDRSRPHGLPIKGSSGICIRTFVLTGHGLVSWP